MRKLLLAVFITMIICIGLFGYFYDNDPHLEVEPTTEEYLNVDKKESNSIL